MSTATKQARPRANHTHTFQPYPADTRYGYCACGATCRMSPDAAGNVAPVRSDNPMVALYGRCSNVDAHCRTCVHLLRVDYHNKTYRKCELRKMTHGAGSDHRAKWDACGKYRDQAAHVHEEIEAARRAQDEVDQASPAASYIEPSTAGALLRVKAEHIAQYQGIDAGWIGRGVGGSPSRVLVDFNGVAGQYGRRMVRREHLEIVKEYGER